VDSGEEGRAVFGVACRNAPPSFEHQERVFDQVTCFIEVFVVGSLDRAVFLWRDDDVHTPRLRQFKDRIGIIAFVRDQMIGIDPFHQAASLCAIRCGTLCNKDSDRHTMRIHGQMYLGVEPPFVRPIS